MVHLSSTTADAIITTTVACGSSSFSFSVADGATTGITDVDADATTVAEITTASSIPKEAAFVQPLFRRDVPFVTAIALWLRAVHLSHWRTPTDTAVSPPQYPAGPVCTILFSSGLSVLLFIFTVRQNVDTTAYLFARDGVFLQNAYWLLTYPDTDTTAARTCLTEGSSTAAVIVIKEVDGYVLEPVSVRSLTPPLANKGVAVFTSCRTAN